MNILDLPGNLGSARGSLLTVLHYDWPSYPIGDGYFETLLSLSLFAEGTDFIEVDNGDGTILFAANTADLNMKDLYNDKNFHVCAWHSDLLEMKEAGLVDGIEAADSFEFEMDRWNKMVAEAGTDKFYYEVDGQRRYVPTPVRDEDFDEEDEPKEFAVVPSLRIRLTQVAFAQVRKQVEMLPGDYIAGISPVVSSLYDQGHYEPAVRQAVVTLEDSIRKHLKSDRFGVKLGLEFIEYLRNEGQILESTIRSYSQELRMVFKFIRNLFAHNIVEVDQIGACVLLLRVYRVLNMLRRSDLT